MASMLTTRRLVLALRPAARRAVVLPAFCRPQPCNQRGFWFRSGGGSSDDGNSNKPGTDKAVVGSDGALGTSSGSGAAPPETVENAISAQASPSLQESSDAHRHPDEAQHESALVPVEKDSSGLRKDTGPPFEPRLMVLPLTRRPLFPGQQQLVQVTHPVVVKDILKLLEKGTPPFVGAFLRRNEAEATSSGGGSTTFASSSGTSSDEDFSNVDPQEALYSVGTRARILQLLPMPTVKGEGDTVQVVLHGHDLIHMDKVVDAGPPLQAQVSKIRHHVDDKDADSIKAYINETMHTVREIMKINPQFREHAALIHQGLERMARDDAHAIAHFAASLTTGTGEELMQVLEAEQPAEKLRLALTLVKKELELSQLQAKIASQIEEKVTGQQREFMLREQLRLIKKELGEDKNDGSDKLVRQFRERLESKDVPKEAKEAIDNEMEKFSGLAKESQEFQMTRNYLDWLTKLPWGVHSQDVLSLEKARAVLDRDHYGLMDVKERILELIAVGSLRGSVQGKILCLVGPPGVGKTSIGRSIADALGREFYRFSVGGLYDVAEIKGHRRTYVGAMPGKMVQCLKKTQTSNPLVLIDEVDKIGRGHQGDPASALLELLDPSQNYAFLDHYLDVPVDCSRVLFVCTANVTDSIPGPLLDRMEVIRIAGYDLQEKLKIAEDYLVPSAMKEVGLLPDPAKGSEDKTRTEATTDDSKSAVPNQPNAQAINAESNAHAADAHAAAPVAPVAEIEKGALIDLIRWYCREAGVRNLQKHIEKICRKLATKVVEHRETLRSLKPCESPGDSSEQTKEKPELDLRVVPDRLSEYVGKPVFTSDRLYEDILPAGTVTGLAWTAMGGSVLYAEAAALPRVSDSKGTPTLNVTGQLGSVMKESSQIALLVARREARARGLSEAESFFESNELHLHCPEGATPKDGPSAGVTIVTSMLSLGLNHPVRADLAMTGEVSLNGKVLAVGGLKEKTIAARRAGCKQLIFPHANRRDFDELPEYLKEGLEVSFAIDYDDVFKVAFASLSNKEATESPRP